MPRKSTDTHTGWYPHADPIGIPEGNYGLGNDDPLAAVIHIIDGSLVSCISHFSNASTGVSAHFGIGKNGAVKQFVSIHDTAFANGLSWNAARKCWVDPEKNLLLPPRTPPWSGLTPPTNPNRYTISIEREGKPADVPTKAMDDATIALLQWLATQYPATLQPYRAFINLIGHRHIGPIHRANCPGPHVDFGVLATRANLTAPLHAATIAGPGGMILRCSAVAKAFYDKAGGVGLLGLVLADERATVGQDGRPCSVLPCERAIIKTATEGPHLALLDEAVSEGWIV